MAKRQKGMAGSKEPDGEPAYLMSNAAISLSKPNNESQLLSLFFMLNLELSYLDTPFNRGFFLTLLKKL